MIDLKRYLFLLLFINASVMCIGEEINTQIHKFEDGNANMKLFKFEKFSDSRQLEHNKDSIMHTPRERKKKRKDMFQKLLPMFIMPYLVQSAILPMILMSLKAMLLKSLLIGKLALILIAINALRIRSNQQFDDSHNTNALTKHHYGYTGNEEFGAYVN